MQRARLQLFTSVWWVILLQLSNLRVKEVEIVFVQLCQTDGKQRECKEYASCYVSMVNCLMN